MGLRVDAGTAALLTAIGSFGAAYWLLSARLAHRLVGLGTKAWGISLLLQGLGWVLLGLRPNFPVEYTAIPGTLFIMIASVLQLRAFAALRGKSFKPKTTYVLLGLTAAVHLFFGYFQPNGPVRVVATSLFTAAVAGQTISVIVRGRVRVARSIIASLTGLYGLIFVVLAARAIIFCARFSEPNFEVYGDSPANQIGYAVFFLTAFLPSLGFFSLCNDYYDQQQQNHDGEMAKISGELIERYRVEDQLLLGLAGFVYRCRNDADWTITYMSSGAYEITGYPESDFVESSVRSFGSIMHPDDVDRVWKSCQANIAARNNCSNEYRIIRPSGEVRWVWDQAHGVHDAAGALQYIEGLITDVTERKVAEERLKNSEARYRGLVHAIPEYVMEIDRSFNFVYLNKVQPGFTLEDFIGKSIWNGVPETDQSELKKRYEQILATGIPDSWEMRAVVAPDQMGWYRIHANRLVAADGKVSILSVGSDITERRQTEEAVRENQARLEMALIAGNQGAWLVDWQKKSNNVDDRWAAMLGYTIEEVGQKLDFWESRVHPDDLKQLYAAFERHERGEIPMIDVEVRARTKGGEWKWISDRAQILKRTPTGEPWIMAGIHTDITERKLAEELARQTAVRLDLATRAANVAVWEYDIVHNELIWDDQSFRLYGITRETFSGVYEAWRSGLHPDDIERGDKEIQQAINGEREFNTEFRVVWPDKSIHYIRALATVVRDAEGKALRMIGTNWDITTEKLHEAELLEKELILEERVAERTRELTEVNTELEAFSYSVSHDLRAPITRIEGWVNVFAADLGNQLSEKNNEYLARIRVETKRMTRMIKHLIAMAKTATMVMEKQKVNMTALAHRLIEELSLEFPELKISANIAEHLQVTADPTLLEMLLQNLLHNAVKFSAKKDIVRIEFGRSISESTSASAANREVFFVRDNGAGFNTAYADKLFAPFQRMHSEAEFTGTGIGLATVRRILSRHGGKIWVESARDAGSTFFFTIPQPENYSENQGPVRP